MKCLHRYANDTVCLENDTLLIHYLCKRPIKFETTLKITDMKALVIVLGMLLTVSFSTQARTLVEENDGGKEEIVLQVSEDDDTVYPLADFGDEEPAVMSLLPQQPYAYLYINKVVVSFDGICQNVRISVVNNDTDEVVFEEVYAGSPEVSIRLAERGDYTLLVRADGTVWEGWFVY